MHAYVLIGTDTRGVKNKTEEFAKKFSAKIMEYPLEKIEDVRNLNSFLRLTITEPTLIYSPNIHKAGVEALNAFLKNLEEPQENLYFVLTAPNTKSVLPTVVSRCQVINIKNENVDDLKESNEEIDNFMKLTLGERIAQTDKIKDREVAIEFVINLINNLHTLIHLNRVDYKSAAENLETMTLTLTNLKKNGNVNLQLTNMVISLV